MLSSNLPRSRVILIVLVILASVTFSLYHVATPRRAWASLKQSKTSAHDLEVLPSYTSSSGLRQCLPDQVAGYVLFGGQMGDAASRLTSTPLDQQTNESPDFLDLSSSDLRQDDAEVIGFHEGDVLQEGPRVEDDAVPVNAVTTYMLSHLAQLQRGYNKEADRVYLGLDIGETWDLGSYYRELMHTYTHYLARKEVPLPDFLPPVLSRISLRPPIAPLPPRPRQILTTDKHKSVKDLPWQFTRWSEIMPDWNIRYFDDEALEDWVNEYFDGTRAEQVWTALPRPVLKADIFRYMAMLVEGGIYTDSDTAPIIHADQWGYPHENNTDPLLVHLSRILSLSETPYVPEESLYERSNGDVVTEVGPGMTPIVTDGAELGPPSLVVSVESDAIEFGWDNWREVGLSRAVQITQWTFMARPGHPVFLDAIGRTLKRSEEYARMEQEAVDKGEIFMPESALDWTGPGVFTDCVYRWLLTRYGFHPRQLIHQKDPIRIGDVLILPAGSYSSVSPFTGEEQRRWAASYHGFFGRWRYDDPRIVEFERLKKIKEEEEKELERLRQDQEASGRGVDGGGAILGD